ncbi:efflux RND transporter permease subunit [Natronospira bacteriovora]|uniref:CusA/CzcA family heavy metal efflux RND transporter n=1 Tax=Natronospira bacteriovora TaxID=3069753 RepID=A0ABU0W8I2_9GAMM|nr:CusA/CzcA family heavy metal efflux RND transporter [Natronospira sp. AB-CW4]MDQ2070346.1 CusA/CzcA family heavy metal efflux RND transporter [Natronospira sp. AB-CW4]
MVENLIRWSIANRVLVLILALVIGAVGLYAVKHTPVDAIPDLSDTQVIVRAEAPGLAPEVVEAQVTYPLTTALMAVPGAETVRGFSMYGDAFINVLFDDATDLYWARSRVQEYLSQVEGQLPDGVTVSLGPDATGVGWIYKYALVDRSGEHDLAQLRALQDWYLKFELQSVPGVAEVATVGGMVRQYQVVMDPDRMRAYGLSISQVRQAIQAGNAEAGGSILEMAEAEYMVRASGYVQSLDDLRLIPVGVDANGVPVMLENVADIRRGPAARRGIAELDGEGEVVGGIVVMRDGENARETIRAVRSRLDELKSGLPAGVEIVETYDRSALIGRAIATLWEKLALEFAVVVLIIGLFLWHMRSSLVVLISLPLGVLAAYIIMYFQGINANIMSLGGIAISIGVMVDAAIVLIENVHRRFEKDPPPPEKHWAAIEEATLEVGRPIFFSLLVVALSFLPVFALEAQEGRLFAPLAFTKTYAMAAAAGIAVTLVPVLMGYFIRGHIRPQEANPFSRGVHWLYRPIIHGVLRHPVWVLVGTLIIAATTFWPVDRMGSEFMPELDEGDLMYMPTTLPGISPDKARELLQQTDALIKQVPEVKRVFGKVGRADTATDPAPMTMIETFIMLKPRNEWRDGVTTQDIKDELDALVQFPGLTNAWVFPIQTRIDMLATGIRTDLGIGISGPDLAVIEEIGQQIEAVVNEIPGTQSALADRTASGRYLDVHVDRRAAARFGLNIDDVHEVVRYAIGGMNVGETVEGLERFPINIRYPHDWRDSPEKLEQLPFVAPNGTELALGQVAHIGVSDGPAMIRTENTRPTGFVFVEIGDRSLGDYVAEARARVAEEVDLPAGYSLSWGGQYQYMERAMERLSVLIPIVLAIIVVLLMMTFNRLSDVFMVLLTVPLSLVGGFWLMWLLGFDMSIAVAVGFIALGGLAVETGVIMLVYLNQAFRDWQESVGENMTRANLREAITEGALRRVRPITMTETTVFLGLLPIMIGTGTGAEVMQRIAAPMVGGVFSVWVTALVVLPVVFYLVRSRGLRE